MSTPPLITEADRATLSRLLSLRRSTHQDVRALVSLSERLKEAQIVRRDALPPTVVTLNSRLLIRTLGTSEERTVTLVPPGLASAGAGHLSVLTPVGMALFGRSVGDVVEVEVPAGRARFSIADVLYQPEAEEDRAIAA